MRPPEIAPASGAPARVAGAFGDCAATIRRFAWAALAVMAFAFLANAAKMVLEVNAPGFGGEAVRIDFTAFWGAAKLALAGEPAAAFDPARLRAALALPPGTPPGDLFWLYPPAWHLALAPLGLLSFSAAYLAFSAVSLGAFAAAVRPLAAPLPGGAALVLAAPAVLIALMLGNNSLLWSAGLAAALGALASGRAAPAGLIIALLTVKPQLGLLVPVALVAAGHWRAFLWATAGTLALLVVSTLVMGPTYWQLYFATLRLMSGLMTGDVVSFERMMTWYALLRLGGAGHAPALAAQIGIGLAAAAAVGWVWSRPRVTTDLKAAALAIAAPLATPYAYSYEMTLGLVAALFLARDGFGAGWGARLWLGLLWLGPLPSLVLPEILPPALYGAPLATATLGLAVMRARRTGA